MSGTLIWRPSESVSLVLTRRFIVVSLALVVALIASAVAAVQVGSADISLGEIAAALFRTETALGEDALTIYHFRIPRVVGGLICGALVAASGYLLQVVSRNGLADAGILGISEGAIAAVVLTVLLVGPVPREALTAISVAGAFATGLIVLILGQRMMAGSGFILVGIAVNIMLGSVVTVVVVAGGIERFASLLVWSRGTLATISRGDMTFLLWTGLPLIAGLLALSRHMAPFALGAEQARAMGHANRAMAGVLILMAAAMLAPVVATSGPVAFLGLMSAYFARRLVGGRPGEVLVVTMLVGALLLLGADTLGRSLFYPVIVTAGILVSVIGVPAFLLAARLGRGTP